jgi:hypothetical protein
MVKKRKKYKNWVNGAGVYGIIEDKKKRDKFLKGGRNEKV